MRRFTLSLFLSFFVLSVMGEVIPKTYRTKSTILSIKIDGDLSDPAWATANLADQFIQLEPVEGAPVTQQTEVRVLYDQTSVYISAHMYDSNPDSILHQLGNRDEMGSLNSDAFRIGLDPYNKRQNAYVFELSASGVQSELLDDDITFDAVWESAARMTSDGWIAEIRIPYSALRFPSSKLQSWGVQFARLIRRNREYDQWTLTPKNVQNRVLFWGTMEGIEDVHPPLRLSMVPYVSLYGERSPDNENGQYSSSYSYSGGADVKYGIDERFTVDMTLLPDFSQVQSDNKIRNLSAFEVIYNERRPFFKEGTSLFSKGQLFYSRRIGRTPQGYYDAPYLLAEGETLEKNPDKAHLINATKLSGRTDRGLGVGFLNAITGNTFAIVKNADGSKRKILTDPLTNFNLFIFDQQFKNNSNLFLINTNVIREGKARDANVTTLQGVLENKKHQYRFTGRFSESKVKEWLANDAGTEQENLKKGNQVVFVADKISGVSYYGFNYEQGTKGYDKNDLGYIFVNDYSSGGAYYNFNIFNPFLKHFRQGSTTVSFSRNGRLSEHNKETSLQGYWNLFLLFNNNWSLYADFGGQVRNGLDYFEPRIEGRYLVTRPYKNGSLNFTTNYNKKIAFDFGARFFSQPDWDATTTGYYISPIIRFSDHLSVNFSNNADYYHHDRGFVFLNSDTSVFGRRELSVITNTVSSRYLFKNDMSIALNVRHYWSKAKYDNLYFINSAGDLNDFGKATSDINFNSSYFTVDLVYNWVFAPGSSFLITYKNQILTDGAYNQTSYFKNLSRTLRDPQRNSISLKVLYFLDYERLTHRHHS